MPESLVPVSSGEESMPDGESSTEVSALASLPPPLPLPEELLQPGPLLTATTTARGTRSSKALRMEGGPFRIPPTVATGSSGGHRIAVRSSSAAPAQSPEQQHARGQARAEE